MQKKWPKSSPQLRGAGPRNAAGVSRGTEKGTNGVTGFARSWFPCAIWISTIQGRKPDDIRLGCVLGVQRFFRAAALAYEDAQSGETERPAERAPKTSNEKGQADEKNQFAAG